MAARQRGFGQQWLFARLSQLLPDFPHVRLCVALSGGVDSSALLAALATPRHVHPALRAVHVDHGLHPNSRLWSAHCRALARRLNVPLQVLATKVGRVRGESLEALARTARYALLEGNLAAGEVLLTAHHQDDQLETVLLQLFRGSGVAGLSGMPELAPFGRGFLARPLLSCTRAQLEQWASSRDLEWVEDDTNADETLDRNYLRRRVLPLLRARWPGIGVSVGRSARHAAQAQRLLDEVARRDVERAADGDCLAASALRGLTPERRRNAVRFWIARSGFPAPDTRRLVEICGPLLEARWDANPAVMWGKVILRRERGQLAIGTVQTAPVSARSTSPLARTVVAEWNWTQQPSCELPNAGQLELTQEARGPLDLDALPASVTVRTRVGGERLKPRKGGRTRTLKSLLQEAHVPPGERGRLPLVCCGERVLAVADLWLDESVQAGPDARRRGRLLWHR
jgi:tRNA(Ile)-lysidine synthase